MLIYDNAVSRSVALHAGMMLMYIRSLRPFVTRLNTISLTFTVEEMELCNRGSIQSLDLYKNLPMGPCVP